MTTLSTQQFDSFFCGLAFLWLAAAAHVLRGQPGPKLPWSWLAMFGLIKGLSPWLVLLAPGQPLPTAIQAVRVLLAAGSLVALAEFGRQGWRPGGRALGIGQRITSWFVAFRSAKAASFAERKATLIHRPILSRWVYLPLLCLTAVGGVLGGLAGVEAASWYAIGIPGALLAGISLWRVRQTAAPTQRRPLLVAALALLVYATCAALAVPSAAIVPARWLNETTFSAAAGFPVQVASAACLWAAATSLWLCSRSCGSQRSGLFRQWRLPAAIAMLVAIGWAGTHWYANHAEPHASVALTSRTGPAASSAVDGADTDSSLGVEIAVERPLSSRARLTLQRLRNGLPALLFCFGLVSALATVWAVAQRFSRG
jgi:hypothetical protein